MVCFAEKMSHFDVMSVKFLFCSLVVLRDYSYSKLEVPWQLKNVPPNATASRISSAPLVVQLQRSHTTLEAWPPNYKAVGYFSCYNRARTLQSTPSAKARRAGLRPLTLPGWLARTGGRGALASFFMLLISFPIMVVRVVSGIQCLL